MSNLAHAIEVSTAASHATRVAIARILFMVMPVDGESHPRERERLLRILGDDFDLGANELRVLVTAVERESGERSLTEAVECVRTTLAQDDVVNLISHMWEMVFADGRLHESEVLLVERTAALLNVSQQEVARLMQH